MCISNVNNLMKSKNFHQAVIGSSQAVAKFVNQ